ncbi:MAG: hypothetical protein V1792_09650 [Pseudomonadota bacterium]
MMKEIRIPLETFDLDGFINDTLHFLETVVSEECDPSYGITWVEAPGGYPHDGDQQGWDFRAKLMNEPVHLFFTFAFFSDDKIVDCADGNSYQCPWKNTGYCDPAQEEDDEADSIPFTVEDLVGYLVRVEEGTISVSSATSGAVLGMPPFRVDLLPDGDFLEQPLVNFVNRFVIRDVQEPTPEEAAQRWCEECQRSSASQKPSDMGQEMKERIKKLLREDAGKGFDIVILPETQFKDFSVVIDTRTEDCLKRTFSYWYSDRTKSLHDSYVFARGEVVAEEWKHSQTWGPKSRMNLERAAKLFWDALQEAKRELESEGRGVKLRLPEDQRGAP